jgi:hypothetical protein
MIHMGTLIIVRFVRRFALVVSRASLSMFERKNISGNISDMNV